LVRRVDALRRIGENTDFAEGIFFLISKSKFQISVDEDTFAGIIKP